jgi:hypothetical protein
VRGDKDGKVVDGVGGAERSGEEGVFDILGGDVGWRIDVVREGGMGGCGWRVWGRDGSGCCFSARRF